MTEEKRLLITRIELGQTEDHKSVVEMYEKNPRLKYPSLRLFDLSELLAVGIDPNTLERGEERFCRFYAWYVESERVNQAGNPYRDVTRLQAIEAKQGGAVQETLETILALLKSIDRRLASIQQVTEVIASEALQLANVTQDVGPENWPDDDEPEAQPQPQTEPEPTEEPEGETPVLDEDMARRRFGKIAGPAIRAGKLDAQVPGILTSQVAAKALKWRDALAQLEAAIEAGGALA